METLNVLRFKNWCYPCQDDTMTDESTSSSDQVITPRFDEAGVEESISNPKTLSRWFIEAAFLFNKDSCQKLLNCATENKNELAQAFTVRLYQRGVYKIIEKDTERAEIIAQQVSTWLFMASTIGTDSISEDDRFVASCSQYLIGFFYSEGLLRNNGKNDVEEALKWFQKSADAGYAPAQSNLGVCLETTNSKSCHENQAIKYYSLAAAQEFCVAQCNLGYCYMNGVGVKKDVKRGVELYKLSASQGYPAAFVNLGYCYEKGEGVQVDKTQAIQYYARGAELGHITAQYNLGLIYEKGEVVEKDVTKALHWFQQAAKQGDKASIRKVSILEHEASSDNCAICLEKANLRGRQFLITPGCCGKLFHQRCFQNAMQFNKMNKCPVCREEFEM